MQARGQVLAVALVAMLSAGTAAARADDDVARVAPGSDAPGGEKLEWTTPEGQEYWYRVPKKMSARKPPALIVMLHGTGLDHRWSFFNYDIEGGGFRRDDVVVSPDGLTPGGGDTFNFVQGRKDGEQIEGLIKLFREQYPLIDRVYLYGHSQGAFFCYWFAGEYPELVDGICAHAGNVLDVKHSRLAKEKVAIGILHGKADAVVTVECAYRTEKIYRDEGYAKLKLYVVEGLTATSGHWPLPVQVGEMLEWLDQVTVATAGQAVRVALSELAKEAPDLAVLARAVESARGLIRKHKGDDRAELERRLELVDGFLDDAATAHAEAFAAAPELAEKGPPFGAWCGHFAAVASALEGRAAWDEAARPAAKAASKATKAVAKALSQLDGSKRGFSKGRKALEAGYASPRYAELVRRYEELVAEPPEGVKDADRDAARAIVDGRRGVLAEGRSAAAKVTAERAAAFREAHADLFSE